ncbi:hypothetical protein CDAR_372931 [Caerostris darwini]|uniref:Uncharacterized protein n=1 Tax=Caerostris darwini TaxID=1538125 RepID=A0AAV4RUC0_9ARAC|nr:hypothetical protein CDAR_372821 [Caerostris darwini]GIY24446.1 hypothetical protein CDAR_372931 [Caerostris darwini]
MINLHSNVRPVPQVGPTLLEPTPSLPYCSLRLRGSPGCSSAVRIAETVLGHRSLQKAPSSEKESAENSDLFHDDISYKFFSSLAEHENLENQEMEDYESTETFKNCCLSHLSSLALNHEDIRNTEDPDIRDFEDKIICRGRKNEDEMQRNLPKIQHVAHNFRKTSDHCKVGNLTEFAMDELQVLLSASTSGGGMIFRFSLVGCLPGTPLSHRGVLASSNHSAVDGSSIGKLEVG